MKLLKMLLVMLLMMLSGMLLLRWELGMRWMVEREDCWSPSGCMVMLRCWSRRWSNSSAGGKRLVSGANTSV